MATTASKIILLNDDVYQQKKMDVQYQYTKLLQNENHQQNTVIDLKKNTSNLFRYRKPSKQKIDLRHFNHVLSIDPILLEAEIEGLTTYEEIVKITLSYGFLPTVVPELKSITIGGALAGVAIESSSFRYGLVHETMLEYEVLLADGRIVICTPTNEHRDLYYALPNTYGTLGYALKIKVKLIPALPFIKLTHTQYQDVISYFKAIEKICTDNQAPNMPISYIDGTIFTKNDCILSTAEFIKDVPFSSNYQYMHIYYRSLKKKKIDYLKTIDYIWRWDPDWFWCSKHLFLQNPVIRLLFGKFCLKSTFYWKVRQYFHKHKYLDTLFNFFKGRTETIIQDIQVPITQANDFLSFFDKHIGIKPIWICPTKAYHDNKQYSFYKMDPNILYINFGFWDMKPTQKPDGFYNKKIEETVEMLGGNKSLYSDVYYSLTDFWQIYDKHLYSELKRKYDPKHHFSDIYHKCQKKK